MPPKTPASPKPTSPQLWKEAYEKLAEDPDESGVIEKFRKVIMKDCMTLSDLSTRTGREQLVAIMDQKSASVRTSTSPRLKDAVKVANKLRDLVCVGANASPFASVAVAGLFVAFDLVRIHSAEKEAIFRIVEQATDAAWLGALEDNKVSKRHPNESQELLKVRRGLRGAYVNLYRTILYLSMRLAYKLEGWSRFLVGFGDWSDQLDRLEDAKGRVSSYLESIHRSTTTPPTSAPNWKQRDKKETDLHRLVKNGKTDAVFNMIHTGQCPREKLNAKTSKGWTALMFAVKDGHWKIMNYLLDTQGIWTNAKNADGNTALILAAQNNRPRHAKKLLAGGAKLEVRNNRQRTAFLQAAMKGHLKVMQVLAEKGDEVNQVTGKNGWCALHTATEKNCIEMARWLVEKNAKQHLKIKGGKRKGMTPKMLAKELDRPEILGILC